MSAIGFVISFFYFIMWVATEIALTTKRVIFKKGLFFVDVKEVDLEEIKAANIDNGVFGTFLNYGYLFFDARFIKNLRLPALEEPYRFVEALNDAKSHLKTDSMNVVLNTAPDTENVNVKTQTTTKNKPNIQNKKYSAAPDAFDTFNDDDLKPEQKTQTTFPPAPPEPPSPDNNAHIIPDSTNSQEPVVFEQDLKTLKQRMQERFLRTFKRNAKKKQPAKQ